jgi:hypothetical protein
VHCGSSFSLAINELGKRESQEIEIVEWLLQIWSVPDRWYDRICTMAVMSS